MPTFDQAIFEGPVGVIQGPVPSQFGFHLIRVDRRNPAGLAPVEEVAGSIRERLAERAFELYVNRLVARSAVQTFPDRLGSTEQ